MKAFNPFGNPQQPIIQQPKNVKEQAEHEDHQDNDTYQEPAKSLNTSTEIVKNLKTNTTPTKIIKAFNPFGLSKQPIIPEQESISNNPVDNLKEQSSLNKSISENNLNQSNHSTLNTKNLQTIQYDSPKQTVSNGFKLNNALDQLDNSTLNVKVDSQPKQINTTYAQHHDIHDIPFQEEKKLTAYEEKKIAFNALKEKVKYIKLSEIAKFIGASNREDKIKNKWKMPWGHNVSIQGQQWFNHNSDSSLRGGKDAISFAKYIAGQEFGLNLDDKKDAWKAEIKGVEWLADSFGAEIDKSDILVAKESYFEKEKKIYSPPKNLLHYQDKVIDYLHNHRKLPLWIINKQIDAGKLYAGIPKNFEFKNIYDNFGKRISKERDLKELTNDEIYCIFKSGDDKLGAAECRCIKDENQLGFTKGFSEGSEKKYSGFLVVGETGFDIKEIAITESAIDSLSYQVLYPWAHTISCGGTDNPDFMLRIISEVLEHPIYKISIALDNDSAGEHSYQYLLEQLTIKYSKEKMDEFFSSGKISRKIPPSEKDWNKYLTTLSNEEILNFYYKNTFQDTLLSNNMVTTINEQLKENNCKDNSLQMKDLTQKVVDANVAPTKKKSPFVFNFK